MRTSAVASHDVAGSLRLDAKFHLSRQSPLLQQLAAGNWPLATLGQTFGREQIWTGNIFTRVYASDPDQGLPLLVPYDLFRYIPWSDKYLSATQVAQFERLRVQRGWLFLVCSGRNLGPVTIADAFCERFTMSHDMVRISAEPSEDLFYVAAFLSTAHGQERIRTDMNGSVIDHTDHKMVAAISYPLVDAALRKWVSDLFRYAFERREEARLLLDDLQKRYLTHFHLDGLKVPSAARARRFTATRQSLRDRIDAEPNAPIYKFWREAITARGGSTLSVLADVFRPASRYKTNYVDDMQYGIPMMNGRQIAQYRPIALKLMNLAGFKRPEIFQIESGMTLLTADGRVEENLADCVMVADDRNGWAASGHVHRVRPKPGINPGLIYLGCSCAPVQAQLKSLATGSVVDALSEGDVGSVVIPYDDGPATLELGEEAVRGWKLFSEASECERRATEALEAEFRTGRPA